MRREQVQKPVTNDQALFDAQQTVEIPLLRKVARTPGTPAGPPRQRLAVFLDGTWNERDDSTNVRHLHTLTMDRYNGVPQRQYYDEGVGTGLLDGLSGGGFGFGLEGKVRAAYNWLAEHYHDADDEHEADEIYIFGFSRGAYTARSLVGFISKCGLVRRGAPLTVTQLWHTYSILGREDEERPDNWWERFVGRREKEFRALHSLQQSTDVPTPAEQRLLDWSRRPNITYLGIFDTVGAMGLDALAIPGLRSKLALHHNMKFTKIIKACHHALAIDEHRSSFRPTPLVAEWDTNAKTGGAINANAENVHQQWFVGAHSNVGGGYPDNMLASTALDWVVEGARTAGLGLYPFTPGTGATISDTRDSFYDFVRGAWAEFFRSKRAYRRINPPMRVRRAASENARLARETINETVHPSVVSLASASSASSDYAPPNLIELARRSSEPAGIKALADRPCPHKWHVSDVPRSGLLLGWAALGAAGLEPLLHLFYRTPGVGLLGVMAVAFALVLVDWAESWMGHAHALDPDAPFPASARRPLTWMRLLGVLLVTIGSIRVVVTLIHCAWGAALSWSITDCLAPTASALAYATLAATAALTLTGLFTRSRWAVAKRAASGFVIAALGFAIVAILIVFPTLWLGYALGATARATLPIALLPTSDVVSARLLFLGPGCFFLWSAFRWVRSPLKKANLGSITRLYRARTSAAVGRVLSGWCMDLKVRSKGDDATPRMQHAVSHCLWRDCVGLVVVYSLVAGDAYSIGTQYAAFGLFNWDPTGYLVKAFDWMSQTRLLGAPVWAWSIGVTALADIVENAMHLWHVRRYPDPARAVWIGFVATLVKTIGFTTNLVATLAVVGAMVATTLLAAPGGTRWFIASAATILIAAAYVGMYASGALVKIGKRNAT